MNSLLTHVIRSRYGNRYIIVFERHESGAIHFHFVVYVEKDIRTGFDWDLARQAYEAQKQRNFALAGRLWTAAAEKAENGDFLRGEWKFWRDARKRYRWLGRCEMLPIRSTAEAVSRYTGGYIAKHMQNRREEDKGVRLDLLIGSLSEAGFLDGSRKISHLLHEVSWTTSSELFGELKFAFQDLLRRHQDLLPKDIDEDLRDCIQVIDTAWNRRR